MRHEIRRNDHGLPEPAVVWSVAKVDHNCNHCRNLTGCRLLLVHHAVQRTRPDETTSRLLNYCWVDLIFLAFICLCDQSVRSNLTMPSPPPNTIDHFLCFDYNAESALSAQTTSCGVPGLQL